MEKKCFDGVKRSCQGNTAREIQRTPWEEVAVRGEG